MIIANPLKTPQIHSDPYNHTNNKFWLNRNDCGACDCIVGWLRWDFCLGGLFWD